MGKPPRAANAGNRPLVAGLVALFCAVFAWSAVRPWYPRDWLLENVMVAVGLWILWGIYRKLPFSRLSWWLAFLFLCLHEVGAHYTYAEVPYDAWWRAMAGWSLDEALGWRRNHFDRMLHFLYGLMLFVPWREVFQRLAKARGFWSYALPMLLVMASSVIYELVEWAAAVAFGGELGVAYLGTQGDEWDAQKDMGLAAAGAWMALFARLFLDWRADPTGFAREWRESLRVERAG